MGEAKENHLLTRDTSKVSFIERLMRHRAFQFALQLPNFLVFILVILTGLFGVQSASANFSTVLTWVIWWAFIIFTFLFVGRLWCLMCPMGAVGEWVQRGSFWRRKKENRSLNLKWPRKLRNIWPATFFFLLVTLVDHNFGLVKSPLYTAYFLILMFTSSIVIGLIFEKRTFCRYLCPVGGLIGLYSMFASTELRVKDKEVCKGHPGKDCVRGNENGYACPMFEFPQTLDRNNYCNYCAECIKTCPQNNIAINIRPFSVDLFKTKRKYFDEAALALILTGLTAFQSIIMTTQWADWMSAITTATHLSENIVFSSLFLLTAFSPLGAYLIISKASIHLNGNTDSLRTVFVYYAYAFVPIGLAMHLAHNIFHVVAEGVNMIPILSDPFGYGWNLFGTANLNLTPLLGIESIKIMQMLLVVLGYFAAAYVGYKISLNVSDKKMAFRSYLPILLLIMAFTIVNLWILDVPMLHRH